MSLISQQFRIFVYEIDAGVYRPVCDLWSTSEKEALLRLKSETSREMTLVEKGPLIAMNASDCQFIARAHSDKDRWPRVDTGRLPQSTNEAYVRAAEREQI
jgi:hypothetical protein